MLGTCSGLPTLMDTGNQRSAGRLRAALARKDKSMNWDQIERKWFAMAQRARMDWGAEIKKEPESLRSVRAVTTVEIVVQKDARHENVLPKRTMRP